MRVVLAVAALGLVSQAAQGQGDVFFNTRDLSSGIDVRFVMPDGTFASGPELFVEVLAGPDANSLMPQSNLFRLVDWTQIAVEVQPQKDVLLFDNAAASWPYRFYRAVAP